jgi:glycosyltransferase involved in cell wall biosynthesis
VAQDELASELRRADCLVLPSRVESFGMVVAEALASGTPVIVSSMVGAKDLVGDGRAGWVVPVGDPDALAARMLWCARHPEDLAALAPTARASAENVTWDAYHLRYASLVRELVASPRRSP